MTQRTMNGFEQDFGTDAGTGIDHSDHPGGGDLDELLEQVRNHSVRFLADVPRMPRSLRVRAGEVSFNVEWPDAQQVTEPTAIPAAAATAEPAGDEITPGAHLVAPTVGVYYEAPEPGAAPFVTEGDTVEVGQQVAIVEAMKLMIPVRAERAGRITEALKTNGEAVEYGEALFSFVPSDAG
ncbi:MULTISPECIES: acetyl-CoA carboxylase biotin carboxyl carrier protein subunit [unclassified Actinopolyspora]|uniref:acetyl-CoA carboxylase biotin carboxyl carrier protein n=1 Tax=unclassified Actinopolyspora TaxID=2639451 RepID=UPI0013F654E7|nr:MULTISPECIES: acetyl-CoA carboxylase biotin carboxyl carrier protein subunit [unclassified Actinopolyspora]NHD19326.1 acetyl-CoA carboxylase biotin carboxyl carrier protein subunit [Actinopolyspora sp. BKK2]NHE78450.1 acetyl-CoA carboxylase biotin carboxyl carrier protein subunit [Actinopolyspora sp. BKK1]